MIAIELLCWLFLCWFSELQFVFRQKVIQNGFNNSQIFNLDNHALCDNLDIIKSEICQSNKHGRDKMSTSESRHVVSILEACFVFFRKAIESGDRELLYYSKFCNTSN